MASNASLAHTHGTYHQLHTNVDDCKPNIVERTASFRTAVMEFYHIHNLIEVYLINLEYLNKGFLSVLIRRGCTKISRRHTYKLPFTSVIDSSTYTLEEKSWQATSLSCSLAVYNMKSYTIAETLMWTLSEFSYYQFQCGYVRFWEGDKLAKSGETKGGDIDFQYLTRWNHL